MPPDRGGRVEIAQGQFKQLTDCTASELEDAVKLLLRRRFKSMGRSVKEIRWFESDPDEPGPRG